MATKGLKSVMPAEDYILKETITNSLLRMRMNGFGQSIQSTNKISNQIVSIRDSYLLTL
jgi:hypothetical protein